MFTKVLFDKKYGKNSNIVKYYYNLKYLFEYIPDEKDFSAPFTPVFGVRWSFRDVGKIVLLNF